MKWREVLVFVKAMLMITFGMGLPQALVHIGPPKTASSYVQSTLKRIEKDLNAVNFYWPSYSNGKSMGSKGVHSYFLALSGILPEDEIVKMNKFIQDSLHHNRSIVLSSEGFSIMDSNHIALLKKHLIGFNTTIVFVYRDTLSHLSSIHFERNRFEHPIVNFSSSFSSFALLNWDNLPIQLRPVEVLDRFSVQFGPQHLRVIDLAGTAAANKDVAHEMLCQIAGVLCNRSDLFRVPTFKNIRQDMVPAQVFSFYKMHVTQRECSFCGTVLQEFHHFALRYSNRTKAHVAPANMTSTLLLLRPFAEQIDFDLRKKYGAQILHANQSANFESMRRVRVTELHMEAFVQDVGWNKWIREEYHLARATHRLCNCTAPPEGPTSFHF